MIPSQHQSVRQKNQIRFGLMSAPAKRDREESDNGVGSSTEPHRKKAKKTGDEYAAVLGTWGGGECLDKVLLCFILVQAVWATIN